MATTNQSTDRELYDRLKQQAATKICVRCNSAPRVANHEGMPILRCNCYPDGPSLQDKPSAESKALARQFTENAVATNPDVQEVGIAALAKLYPDGTRDELYVFSRICHALDANPFLREAHFSKLGGKPVFMPGYQLYIKRASQNQAYGGFESGVVVERDDVQVFLDGTLLGSKDVLKGGWCKVYRKDRQVPIFEVVAFKDFDKGENQWKTRPAYMIEKVAISHAHSRAFPDAMENMRSEVKAIDEQVAVIDSDDEAEAQ